MGQETAVNKTREDRLKELKDFNPIPEDWQAHLPELKNMVGDVTLPNGEILTTLTPVYMKTRSAKTGKDFEAVQLARIGSRVYAPVCEHGKFWLIEARVDIIARPINGRDASQGTTVQREISFA